jgi:mono/diheme cytochrome c family protein
MTRWLRNARGYTLSSVGILAIAAFVGSGAAISHRSRHRAGPSVQGQDQVLRGRFLLLSHACGECHGLSDDPAATGWLAGMTTPQQEFLIGPCAVTPGAQPCFKTRPRNLTPDNNTGMGRFSERQIFNALRYGLRPGETPDVEITSSTPGQGNFPAHPKYLAPPMPWPAWRHMPDQDLWAIAAYLKRALKPVSNKVQDSEGPPDFWASDYTVEKIGPYPAPAFPTTNERPSQQEQVLQGRFLVISHDCGACHGGANNPAATGWLAGRSPPEQVFLIGPCAVTPGAQPCFKTRSRNLTPDSTTGLGRYSERQIFNALRYGLRPGETPDVEITSSTPGQGSFPAHPKYLAPPMPWPSWRHMPDQDLWAIAAYLKRGLKPVSNKVQDSEGPPDFWASEFTVEKIGRYPAPAFPTVNEKPPL